MCETNSVVLSISILLLLEASFCIYLAHTENKMGHYSQVKVKFLAKKGTRSVVWTGEGYYPVDEDIAGCNCTWLFGKKKSHIVGLSWKIQEDEKTLIQNLTRRIFSILTRCIFFKFIVWRVVMFWIRNHAFWKRKEITKYVVFTQSSEPKRDFLDTNIFSTSDKSKKLN